MAEASTSKVGMPPPPTPSSTALGKRKASDRDLVIREKDKKLPLSLYRQRILDEDDYAGAIEHIIKRDFFPDLFERDQEAEMETRFANGEFTPGWTLPSSHRGSVVTPTPYRRSLDATPGETPYGRVGETPRSPRSLAREAKGTQEKPFDDTLSLSAFLQRYTSEDNASFADILDRQNADRRVKYSWAYDSERLANERERRSRRAREALVEGIRLAIEASENGEVHLIEGAEPGRPGERLVLEPGRTSIVGDRASIQAAQARQIGIGRSDQLLIAGPDGGKATNKEAQSSAAAAQDDDGLALPPAPADRPEGHNAGTKEAWMHTARNSFFFAPDANESLVSQVNKVKPIVDELSTAERLGLGEPKAISYSNTRLPSQSVRVGGSDSSSIPPSPSASNIAAAISGTPYPGRDPVTPRVGGYSFVAPMPTPRPGDLGPAGLKRLMTRGRITSTPIALSSTSANPAPAAVEGPFKIPPTPRRELLAHKMAGDASKSLRARHGGKLALPTLGPRPRSTSDRGAARARDPATTMTPRASDDLLSPAARTLLGRTGEGRRRLTSGGGSSGSSANRSSLSSNLTPNSTSAKHMDRESRARVERRTWDPTPGGKPLG